MKNILFITDLSEESAFAALDAAALARQHQARLILLYSYTPTEASEATDQETTAAIEAPEHEAQEKLDALAQQLHTLHGVSVTRLLKPRLLAKQVAEIAVQVCADKVLSVTSVDPSGSSFSVADQA